MPLPGHHITSAPAPSLPVSAWGCGTPCLDGKDGAGCGGAAMEAEIVDSVTGEQVAAVIRSGVGSQFRAFNISTVSDVKNTIDVWARDAGHQLDSIQVRR